MIYSEIERNFSAGKVDNGSELFHEVEKLHFATKTDRRVRLSVEERQALKNAMYKFPNKRHTPVGFNLD